LHGGTAVFEIPDGSEHKMKISKLAIVVWGMVVAWFVLLGYHLFSFYSKSELVLLLPIGSIAVPVGAGLAFAWMTILKKGRPWVRWLLGAVAGALLGALLVAVLTGWWSVEWYNGMAALRGARSFRRFPPDKVTRLSLYPVRTVKPGTKEAQRPVVNVSDPDVIRRILKSFNTVRPTWTRSGQSGQEYVLILEVKSGDTTQNIIVHLLCDAASRPPMAHVIIRWKDFYSVVHASEYHSSQLYEELKHHGMP
jgi:hypothetical protein